MNLPTAIAATALAVQVAGGPTEAVARAYACVVESRPDVVARGETKYGRKELLRWQAIYAPTLTRTQTVIYDRILGHYNLERQDSFPGYARIAELAKCCIRTAMRAVRVLEEQGFVTIERRFRRENRWAGTFRHDRTNVYRFPDGAPPATAAYGAANEAQCSGRSDDGPIHFTVPNPPRPNTAPAPAPGPARPSAPSAPPRVQPTNDSYWDVFETAFVLEHRAVYGKDSAPGGVRQDHLREQASSALNELASECVAWARHPEHGLNVQHLQVAEELARRLARAWIRSPGRDNRLRDRGHPLGWMCGDLTRTLCDEAVESWKRAQRRLIPKPVVVERPALATAPDEAAITLAENKVVMASIHKGVDFDTALRLGRAEGARVRAAMMLAASASISPIATEPHEPRVESAGRAPPE